MDDQIQESTGEVLSLVERFVSGPLSGKVVVAVTGVVIIYVIGLLVRHWLSRSVRDDKSRYRSRKLVSFGTLLFALIFVSVVYSEQLTGLTVALGVASAGIAFALQEVIVSEAGWLAISFGDIYKTGDRIRMGGVTGDVIDVSIIRTTLMELGEWVRGDLYTGRVVRVANSYVFKELIFNYSGEFPFLWDEIALPIRHGSDLILAREVFSRVAAETVGEYSEEAGRVWARMVKKYLVERVRVEPTVSIEADENWVTMTMRYVVDYKKRRHTKDLLFTAILLGLERTNGKVQIASSSQEITRMPGPGTTE
jgi:small-conductance mechanosensitive channel